MRASACPATALLLRHLSISTSRSATPVLAAFSIILSTCFWVSLPGPLMAPGAGPTATQRESGGDNTPKQLSLRGPIPRSAYCAASVHFPHCGRIRERCAAGRRVGGEKGGGRGRAFALFETPAHNQRAVAPRPRAQAYAHEAQLEANFTQACVREPRGRSASPRLRRSAGWAGASAPRAWVRGGAKSHALPEQTVPTVTQCAAHDQKSVTVESMLA